MIRSTKKKIAFAAVGLLAVAACFTGQDILSRRQKKMPEFLVVGRGSVVQRVSATGTIFPLRTVRVCSRVPGMIADVPVDYNCPVEKGQLLARIDSKEYEVELSAARADLGAAEAMADKEEIALRHAQARLTRTEALAKEKAVPRNDYDEALSQFELASAQKKAAIAQLDRAKAALRVAQIRIDDSKIVAPVRGVVLSKAAEVGQAVTPASLQGAVLFTIAADLAAMELRVDVAEADIGKVACGQQLTLSVEAFPDTLFYGKVKSIRSEPTVDQKSVSYGVIAEIENRRLLLKPNMTAVVLIETARRDGVHAIPFGALTEKDGHCYVTVPGKEGTFDRREVRKGLRGYDGSIEILSGLRDGDTVIVAAEAG